MARREHKRDLLDVLRRLEAQGWTVEQTIRGHYRCVPPDRTMPIVMVGGSGDWRGLQNALAQLRRSGAQV